MIIIKKCLVCNNYLKIPRHKLKTGRGKFCSRACANTFYKFRTGKAKNHYGYILKREPQHPYADKNGYVLEHRLVMEEKIGRILQPKEIIHHKNQVRDDNKFENLQLMTRATHLVVHKL